MTVQALLGFMCSGDHIERPMKTGVPNHHGIVDSIGNNLDDTYVWHFYGPTSKSEAKVARTTLLEFMDGEIILLPCRGHFNISAAAEILKSAGLSM